jgi:hypothetical protein
MNRRDFLSTAAVGVTSTLVALADSSAQPEPPDRRTLPAGSVIQF